MSGKIGSGHIKLFVDPRKMAGITAYILENYSKAFETQGVELTRATAIENGEVDNFLIF
jgi:hypothetical protein